MSLLHAPIHHAHADAVRRGGRIVHAVDAHLHRWFRRQAQVGLLQTHLQGLLYLGELVGELSQRVQNILLKKDSDNR